MSALDSFQRRMVEKARAELAAEVDLMDTNAMIRRTGRLEVALESLLTVIEETCGSESPVGDLEGPRG